MTQNKHKNKTRVWLPHRTSAVKTFGVKTTQVEIAISTRLTQQSLCNAMQCNLPIAIHISAAVTKWRVSVRRSFEVKITQLFQISSYSLQHTAPSSTLTREQINNSITIL